MPLPVLFVDAHLIVLDKPSGMLSVPGKGPELQDCLASRVQLEYPDALVVHRLDRDTSGLLIMARGPAAQRELSRQFHDRQVVKRYLAVVAGCPADDSGRIDLPLRKDFDHPPRHMVDPKYGRPAVTQWRVVERGFDRTLVELTPLTGRSHQLRIHLQAIGHPILGDKLYAPPDVLAMAVRLMLHASQLALAHPATAAPLEFISPCPF